MPKNPFVNYTIEEILASEASAYVIVVGSDFYMANGQWAFSRASAVRHYNKILAELMRQWAHGTKKEQKNAMRVMRNFRIDPLRFH